MAETASAQGKGSRGERGTVAGEACVVVGMSLLAAAALLLAGGPAMAAGALPQGGTVVGGRATIGQPNANQMLIQQGSQSAAINWQSFNIGAGNSVQFVQPSSSAQVLNRVIGMSGSSQILGTLTANGQVYIVNPQGVVFGKGSVVNAGAILASTRDIDPARFMSEGGRSLFLSGGSNGSGVVQNDGNLNAAPGGWIVLAGDAVKNTGSINAPGGKVGLLAGGEATLALNGGSLVNVQLNASQTQAAIDNTGSIKAGGGTVLLTANTANTLLGSAINLSGVVDVSGAQGGHIAVDAGQGGLANLSGATLNAAGTSGAGGNVTVLGNHVGLFQGTRIDAGGATGGGTVLVGGDFQGKGSLRKAGATVMDASSSIDASAKGNGNGGTVGLWSDSYTQFNGNVAARGGAQGGNGGHVDTSSAGQLGVLGQVTANATHGTNGMWTLDPTDITVSSGADANYTPWFTPTGNPVTVNNGSLSTALQGGTSVTLDASKGTGGSGWINVTAPVTSTGSGNLTLLAANGQNVTIGANISLGSGSLTANGGAGVAGANGAQFQSGSAGGAGGSVVVNVGTTVTAANVTLYGGNGGVGGQGGVGSDRAVGGAGGVGGQVVVNGNVAATAGSVTILAGAGGGGGGGGGCGLSNGCTGSPGGAGGTGGATTIAGTITASGAVDIRANNGGGGGGGGGGGWSYQPSSGGGGIGGAGGSAGSMVLNNATIHAGSTITLAAGSGGGGGGGGGGETTKSGVGLPGSSGSASGAGGAGGAGSNGAGSAGGSGGALGTGGSSGANGSDGANVSGNSGSGAGGAGGAGAGTITVNGTSTLTGANLSVLNALDPIVINGNMVVNVTGSPNIANNISGPGVFTQAGTGTTVLSGTDTFGGGINITNGGVNVTGTWTPSTNAANVTMSNGTTLAAANITAANTNVTGTGNITLKGVNTSGNLSANTTGNLTLAGALKSGANMTLIAGSAGVSGLVNGTDTAGDVILSGGSIALPNTSTLTVYTGNDNLQALDAAVTGGTGATTYATYNATLGNMSSAVAGTRNYYARVQSNATLTGVTATKVYDGTNTALGFTNATGGHVAMPGGANLTVSNLTVTNATFNTTHAGSDLLNVTASANGTGTINNRTWNIGGITATQTNGTGTITPKAVTVTLNNVTKTYDGTTNATVNGSTATGLLTGDTLVVTGNGSYNNQHVLNASNASFNTASLSDTLTSATLGSLASDYNFSYANTTNGAAVVGGTITKANVTLTGNLTASDKVYDGTNAAQVNVGSVTAQGVHGETLTVNASGATAAFNTTHVGNGLNVSIANVTLSNGTGLVSDYNTQSLNANATGNITPAALTVTATTDTKVYDGTTNSSKTATVTGLKGSDTLNGTVAQAFNSSHVLGTNGSTLAVTQNLTNASITGGGYITDYTVSYVNATGTVTPKNVTVTLNNVTKTYDGTTNATLNGSTATGLLAGDTLTVTGNGSYNSPHVLNASNASFATANLSGNVNSATLGSLATDYNLSYANASNGAVTVGGKITPANLTVAASTDTKVYDATTASSGAVTVTGLVGSDTLNGTVAQQFNSSHVLGANGSTLTANALTDASIAGGGRLSDYSVSYVNAKGTITPAKLAVAADNQSGVYGGALPQFTYTVSGLLGSDTAGQVLTGTPGLTSNPTGPGYYTIGKGTLASNADYLMAYTAGTLTLSGTPTVASTSTPPAAMGPATDQFKGSDPVAASIGMTQWPGWYEDASASTRTVSTGQFKGDLLAQGGGQGNGVNVPSMVEPLEQQTDHAKQFDVKVVGSGINLQASR
ncbi:hypothetical protein WK66_07065 [Burkholderia ubonensis]|nr:hypothetical protein WK66_07065 [Burkholderia ubonensis]